MLIIFHFLSILFFKILQKRKEQIKNQEKLKNQGIADLNKTEKDLEYSIRFDPPVYRQRYAAVYETVIDERWRTKISKLCDFGCAEFGLFVFIKQLNRLTDILFIDIDEYLLQTYVNRVHPLTIEYLKRRDEPLTVSIFAGSVGDPDYRILDMDVITAIELIEHLYPDILDAVPYNLFYYAEPKLVIITTPNADFNSLFGKMAKFRHDDHKFEWTREQFEDWANNIVTRFPDYTVTFKGLGEGPEGTAHLGHCSQMALFIRKDLLNERYMLEKYLTPCHCPTNAPCKILKPTSTAEACSCVCPLCSPKESFGICTYHSFSKKIITSAIDKVEQNPSMNIFYKPIEKIEYPFERDNRTEEQKMLDEFRYRINNFGHANSRFFVEERDRAEIPLADLLYGPDSSSITETELGNLLTKHDYQIEKCVIQETNELETCVVVVPQMDNVTSPSDSSDYDGNSGFYQTVKESASDWDDAEQEHKEEEAGSSSKERNNSSKITDELLKKRKTNTIIDKTSVSLRKMAPSRRLVGSIVSDPLLSKKDQAGPSLDSPNPEERKLARRLRLENRLSIVQRGASSSLGQQTESLEKFPVVLQVEKSDAILEKCLCEGNVYISNVLKANTLRQMERKKADDLTKEKILATLEAQTEEAELKFQEITNKWDSLKDLNDPLHINEAIIHQKAKCDELIQVKDDFIKKLKGEIAAVDKRFQTDLLRQHEDIEILSDRIEMQIKLIRKSFRKQFGMIDNVVHMEKDKFVTLHNEIWEELYQNYRFNEAENSEFKLRKQEEVKERIAKLQVDFEEELRHTESSLDQDIQFTRNELEKIKSLILLNLEKFGYNFQILHYRENENIVIKADQKRKMTKLRDKVSKIRKEVYSYKHETATHIVKLLEDIKKTQKSILDVESKADYFATQNDNTFNKLWKMNRKHVLGVLTKIFDTNKVLHQHYMGMNPRITYFKDIDIVSTPSYANALHFLNLHNLAKADNTSTTSSIAPPTESIVSKDTSFTKRDDLAVFNDIDAMDSNPAYRRVVKHLLTILSDKGGFLTEKRLKLHLKQIDDESSTLIKLGTVFDSLFIKRPEDIDALVSFFFPYCYCPVCAEVTGGRTSQGEIGKIIGKMTSSYGTEFTRSEIHTNYSKGIMELDEALEAVQQPNDVIDEIVFQLVDLDLIQDQKALLESTSKDILNQLMDNQPEVAKDKKEKKVKSKKLNPDDKFLYPSSSSDAASLHDALSHPSSPRPIIHQPHHSSSVLKSPAAARSFQLGLQNPPLEEEETDLFEETSSTPSLSSQDNKVHLKRASNIDKADKPNFVPPPPHLDVNKMKLDFNRINELDRVHNIPLGRNFFGHLLRPQSEKLRRSFLKERDCCLAGPSNIPLKKRRKIKIPDSMSDSEDDITPLDDMKSMTNCIVENTLNKLNVDDVKSNKDDVIEFNIDPIEDISESCEETEQPIDVEMQDKRTENNKEGNPPKLQNALEEDIESYSLRPPVDLSSIEQCPSINDRQNNYASAYNVPVSVPIAILPHVPVPAVPNVPIPLPMAPNASLALAVPHDDPLIRNIALRTFEGLSNDFSATNISCDQDETNQESERSIARASREAIVDPNSIHDLLTDMDANNSMDGLNGVDIVDLGSVILVGIHPLADNLDGQVSNGFPNWLLQILGTQVPVSEGPLEEPHYYCQGDGLGVHPSVIAVDPDDEDEDGDEENVTTDSSNTTDFAEVDQGISSPDMSSLPEDSPANTTTEFQDPLEESVENDVPESSHRRGAANIDTGSNSSDTGLGTSTDN